MKERGIQSLCEKRRQLKISFEKGVHIILGKNKSAPYAICERRIFWQFVFHTGSSCRFEVPHGLVDKNGDSCGRGSGLKAALLSQSYALATASFRIKDAGAEKVFDAISRTVHPPGWLGCFEHRMKMISHRAIGVDLPTVERPSRWLIGLTFCALPVRAREREAERALDCHKQILLPIAS